MSGRSQDIRAEILEAATRRFAARGFDGASLADIAEAVGIRKQSLLYHFASKEELHQAVLEGVLARWNERLPRVLAAAAAGEDQFDGITREIVSFFAADPDRARLLVREALDRPEGMNRRLELHVRPLIASLAGHVRRGQRHAVVHPDVDPEAYLFQVVVLLVCGVAFDDSFGALMPESSARGSARERLGRELLRVAKSSLFRGEAAATGLRSEPNDRPGGKSARRARSRAEEPR